MPIDLRTLKRVKQQTLEERKLLRALSSEVLRVIGPQIQVERRSIEQICDDVLYVTEGWTPDLSFRGSLVTRLATHPSTVVRRFAARFAAQNLLEKMASDKSVDVLYEVAARAPIDTVEKILKKHRFEDGLTCIYETRLVEVEERSTVERVDEIDPDVRRSIESQNNHEDDVLDDFWYDDMARTIMETYGNTMNTSWVRPAVNQYAAAVNSMLGIPVDVGALLKAVNALIEERDEAYIAYHDVLKVTTENLDRAALREAFYVSVDDEPDAVETFVNGGNLRSTTDVVETIEMLFQVEKTGTLPWRVKGLMIAEGITVGIDGRVPTAAKLPSAALRSVDEQALDMYVSAWSRLNRPLRLGWNVNNEGIAFSVSGGELEG